MKNISSGKGQRRADKQFQLQQVDFQFRKRYCGTVLCVLPQKKCKFWLKLD